MNWQWFLAQLKAGFNAIQPALIPAEIEALKALESTVSNPMEKVFIDAAIAYLESQIPPVPGA